MASASGVGLGHRYVGSPVLFGEGPDLGQRRRATVQIVADRMAVLVELNLAADAGVTSATARFLAIFRRAFPERDTDRPPPPERVSIYQRCWLTPDEVKKLVYVDAYGVDPGGSEGQNQEEGEGVIAAGDRAIFRVWPDYVLRPHLDRSVSTVNADAAARVYGAAGRGIVWAVVDSGIDATHPHFGDGTLTDDSVKDLHRDFTGLVAGGSSLVAHSIGQQAASPGDTASGDVFSGQDDARGQCDPIPDPTALVDPVGHGTHVAGIIAGQTPTGSRAVIATSVPTAEDLPDWRARHLLDGGGLSGVAPRAKLVSLRVLRPSGGENAITTSSAVIKALAWVREVNADGRQLRIHGVNVSLGCPWFPDDFAAGQSPLCREIDLLVGSGVVVVVSAGNQGASGTVTGESADIAGALSTITDPGNAARAITVGSSHKDSPHAYGVSFTSSKGPTLDGRLKPDLVAPGEHIASAATGAFRAVPPLVTLGDLQVAYREESGTSQAAPHVSGVIAAFLSVRNEFIGQPEEVKKMFCQHTSDLGRHSFFQGAGLVDLMKVLSNL
jgi:subtilisin family serine protease